MMRHQVAACWSLLTVSIILVGCGNPGASKLGQATESVDWEPLDAINSEEYLGGAEIGLGMGDPASAIDVIVSPEFKSGVDKVESEELPSAWSEKGAERTELVTALRDLISAAEANKRGELKAGLDKVKAAIAKLKGLESSPAETAE